MKQEILTVKEYSDFLNNTIETCVRKNNFLISLKGVIGEIEDKGYQKYYVPFYDTQDRNIFLQLEAIKNLLKTEYSNKAAIISGYPSLNNFKGRPEIKISVSNIEIISEIPQETAKQEISLIKLFNKKKNDIKIFPVLNDKYKLFLIYPKSAKTLPDFKNQIRDIDNFINLKEKNINIMDANEIKQALNDSVEFNPNLLVIIRGGGDSSEFSIFNDKDLIEKWINIKSFKISAIGHSQDRTYLDFFADASLDTPTDAGIYIKEQIELIKEKEIFNKKLEENNKKFTNRERALITVIILLIITAIIIFFLK
jgi:exodeoxyribonuclease VII large subunit